MTLVTLDNLVGRGLEREPTDRDEIARLLARADRKLEDSAHVVISLDSRFDIAYEALLQISLAALRANGLRVTAERGHQALAVQSLVKSIGLDPKMVRLVDEFRKKRGSGLYEWDYEPSQAEVESLRAVVAQIRERLIAWLRDNRPELLPQ